MAEYKPTAAGGPRRRSPSETKAPSTSGPRRRQFIDPNAPPIVPELSTYAVTLPQMEVTTQTVTLPRRPSDVLIIGPAQSEEQQQLAKAFEELADTASTLNAASDALAKPIAALDAAFKDLNIGVTTWVKFAGHDHFPHYGRTWGRSIGYAKINGRWGIAISEYEGEFDQPEYESYDSWLFGEAPRSLRVEAAAHLPKLVEALSTAAAKTAAALQSKVAGATQVANVAESIVKARKVRR